MKDIQITNKFVKFNLILGLILIIAIRFIFNDKKLPKRIEKFPIHLPR